MARLTVEDCLARESNRFALVVQNGDDRRQLAVQLLKLANLNHGADARNLR